jgi:alpha-tubulin suppressor-like RCC1 family protein
MNRYRHHDNQTRYGWRGLSLGDRTRRHLALSSSASAVVIAMLASASIAAAEPVAHIAAASSRGKLLAWGDNSDGQLGIGSMTNSDVPVAVKLPKGTRVVQARSGCYFTVALTSTGKLLSWGLNFNSQLGDGSMVNSMTPVRVHIPAHTTITRVRAGCAFALALTSRGQVLAWGLNDVGQLGDGTLRDAMVPTRVHLPKHTVVTGISAGNSYGLALTSTGRVLAWGSNNHDALGDGNGNSDAMSKRPVRVRLPASAHITSVSAGGFFGLAQTHNGGVLAWGDDQYGMLGNGSLTNSDVPVRVKLPHGAKVSQLYAGGWHAMVLTTRGEGLAWGLNESGQLGIGTLATEWSDVPVKVKFPAGTTVTGIAACLNNGLALTRKGHVLAWGDDTFGELGNGTMTTTFFDAPVRAELPAGVHASAVACGPEASVSLAIER